MEEEKKEKDFSLKNKIIINISIFSLIILAIVFVVVVPALRDIAQIRDSINSQRLDLEQKYQRGQNLKRVGEKLRNVRPRVRELDLVFADKTKNLEFVTMLEGAADRRGVSQRINLGSFAKESKEKYEKVSMQLMVSGDSPDVINYLVDLETLPYYINIDSVKFTSGLSGLESPKANPKSPVTMVLTADAYWRNVSIASSSEVVNDFFDKKASSTAPDQPIIIDDK